MPACASRRAHVGSWSSSPASGDELEHIAVSARSRPSNSPSRSESAVDVAGQRRSTCSLTADATQLSPLAVPSPSRSPWPILRRTADRGRDRTFPPPPRGTLAFLRRPSGGGLADASVSPDARTNRTGRSTRATNGITSRNRLTASRRAWRAHHLVVERRFLAGGVSSPASHRREQRGDRRGWRAGSRAPPTPTNVFRILEEVRLPAARAAFRLRGRRAHATRQRTTAGRALEQVEPVDLVCAVAMTVVPVMAGAIGRDSRRDRLQGSQPRGAD